jgi:hypothetical protein
VDFRLPNGTEADYYIKAEGPVSSIFGLTADKKVVLARQYRAPDQKKSSTSYQAAI